MCRFLPLDKEDALKAVTTVRKRWFAKRKGVMALLKEAITREPSVLEDPDAAAKSMDADAALVILGGDYASIGYFTPTVTLMDTDPDRLADRVREVESAINRVGFVCKVEDVNAVEAWIGSLPGQAYADLRRPLVSSLNLCDMMPMSAIWPGPTRNEHLGSECAKRGHPGDQPPLMFTRTAGTTPFRFDLHQGDVGHTMLPIFFVAWLVGMVYGITLVLVMSRLERLENPGSLARSLWAGVSSNFPWKTMPFLFSGRHNSFNDRKLSRLVMTGRTLLVLCVPLYAYVFLHA